MKEQSCKNYARATPRHQACRFWNSTCMVRRGRHCRGTRSCSRRGSLKHNGLETTWKKEWILGARAGVSSYASSKYPNGMGVDSEDRIRSATMYSQLRAANHRGCRTSDKTVAELTQLGETHLPSPAEAEALYFAKRCFREHLQLP